MRVGDHIKKPEVSPVSVSFANIRNPLAIVLLSRYLLFITLSCHTLSNASHSDILCTKEMVLGLFLKTRFAG